MGNTCKVRKIGTGAVLDLCGTVTIGEGDVKLREEVRSQLNCRVGFILVNLTRVRHMDAAGLGQLCACFYQARAELVAMKLLNPSGMVYDLFSLTKLDDVFEIYQDEKEALASFAIPLTTRSRFARLA